MKYFEGWKCEECYVKVVYLYDPILHRTNRDV
jgi:hypothetical protein